MKLHLLTVDSPKTRKGEALGILTGILYMAPSDESGYNVCPMALRKGEEPDGFKSQCSRSCLTFAGKGMMPLCAPRACAALGCTLKIAPRSWRLCGRTLKPCASA